MGTLPQNCDRARAWISLQLDGELSELEGLMLAAHVERCETCRGFAVEAVGFTAALRTAPLEHLERPVTSIARRRRPVGRRAVQFGAAAALVAGAVGLGSIFGTLGSGGHTTPKSQLRPTPIVYPGAIKYAKPFGVQDIRPTVKRVGRKGLTLVEDTF